MPDQAHIDDFLDALEAIGSTAFNPAPTPSGSRSFVRCGLAGFAAPQLDSMDVDKPMQRRDTGRSWNPYYVEGP